VEVELLSGESEGALVFAGARSAFATDGSRTLVADLGGGSLELACGQHSRCEAVRSLPLGFLRLAGAFPSGAPGSAARLARYVEAECQKVRFPIGRFDTLVLTGGTARAVGKLFGGHEVISPDVWLTLCTALSTMTSEELGALGVARDRVDTLSAGAAVLAGLLAAFGGRGVRLSPHGLREGVLLREIAQRAPITCEADLATA
jgi:exopolyphosphatase/guanosine-5'-triphosphate,3'-diphosphate pyrophosphatase